ncbi:hypothetical protein [Streptomyces sp. NPDC050504]|uniref:hypothetical protein n=1 Tax=Streptomyces sp. NPDC050504 TaxID=3365618 RepID=UPI003796DD80
MTVTQHRSRRRKLAVATGAALLAVTVAGCSGLDRTMVGTLSYKTGEDHHVTVTSPSVKGCHRLAPAGAKEIENRTLVDIVLYRTADCTGGDTTYVASAASNVIAPRSLPWRSFTTVH